MKTKSKAEIIKILKSYLHPMAGHSWLFGIDESNFESIADEIMKDEPDKVKCISCNGSGQREWGGGLTGYYRCKDCNGTGEVLKWECPRCHKIHSPFASHCDCPPPMKIATTNT